MEKITFHVVFSTEQEFCACLPDKIYELTCTFGKSKLLVSRITQKYTP